MNSDKKYRIKESWIFNLESMNDKLWNVIYDIRDGEIKLPIEICGKQINYENDVQRLIEEAETLEWAAKSGPVSSKEYGRIEKFVNWRVNQRYVWCLASGMEEKDAGRCFDEL